MGPLSKTAASLRIFGDDLDPDEVTILLGKIQTLPYVAAKSFAIHPVENKPRVEGIGV